MLKKLLYISFFIAMPLALGTCVQEAYADIKRAPKPEIDKKKRYKHACPPGTEPHGAGPPHGDRIYCRQPVPGGSYRAHGAAVKWYGNGKKRHEGEFVRGKRHGVWTAYQRDGRKKSIQIFYNGKQREHVKFDADGNAVQKGEKSKSASANGKKKAFYWQKAMRVKNKKKRRRSKSSWAGKGYRKKSTSWSGKR